VLAIAYWFTKRSSGADEFHTQQRNCLIPGVETTMIYTHVLKEGSISESGRCAFMLLARPILSGTG